MYGIANAVLSIMCFGLLTRYTYFIINDLIEASGKRSYANLCSHYLGKRTAKVIIQFMIFSNLVSGIPYASVGTLA